jgi:hypothetical protein
MTQDEIARILRVWYLIELVSPQAVRFDDQLRETPSHQKVELGTQIRWAALEHRQQALFEERREDDLEDGERNDKAGKTQEPEAKYIVYLGLSKISEFDLAIARAAKLKLTPLDLEQKSRDNCAWATIQLGRFGLFIPESLTISTVPWVLQQLRKRGLVDFVRDPEPEALASLRQAIGSSLQFEPGEPVTPSALFAAAKVIKSACSLQDVALEEHAHISIFGHPAKEHRDLINSFFYEVLRAQSRQTRATRCHWS